MKELRRRFKNAKALVFLDLEGTQWSHEVIEIGAQLVVLGKDLEFVEIKKPLRLYTKPKNRIGPLVEKMTNISPATLNKLGLPFIEGIARFRSYIGKYWSSSIFVAFGEGDLFMLRRSAELNPTPSNHWLNFIASHYFDFQNFIHHYIQNENGNSLSLQKLLEIFEIEPIGKAHDGADDAINLRQLFQATIQKKNILVAEYQKTLLRGAKCPEPIRLLLKELASNETVSLAEFKTLIEESL